MAQRYTGRQLGDRPDGRKIRTLPSVERMLPVLVRTRTAAEEHYRESIEVTQALAWLDGKSREGLSGIRMTHLAAAAFARTVSRLPYLNRYIAGHRIFARYELDVLVSGIGETYSSNVKVRLSDNDTVTDVYHKINDSIESFRAGEHENAVGRVADFLMLLPRFLRRFTMQVLRLCDYYGFLGRKLLFASPWHASLRLFDNEPAGLAANPLPLSNLGTNSVAISLGTPRTTVELDAGAHLTTHCWLDVDIAVDSRIATKAEIEKAILFFKRCLSEPHTLETAPRQTADDVN